MINHDTNCNHSTRQNPAAAGLLTSLTTPTRSTISHQYLEPLESTHQERPSSRQSKAVATQSWHHYLALTTVFCASNWQLHQTVSQLAGDQELFDGTQMTKKTNAWIAPGQLEQKARLGTDTKTPQVAKQLLQTRTPPQALKNNQQISKSATVCRLFAPAQRAKTVAVRSSLTYLVLG